MLAFFSLKCSSLVSLAFSLLTDPFVLRLIGYGITPSHDFTMVSLGSSCFFQRDLSVRTIAKRIRRDKAFLVGLFINLAMV